jgi:hypothetical protein
VTRLARLLRALLTFGNTDVIERMQNRLSGRPDRRDFSPLSQRAARRENVEMSRERDVVHTIGLFCKHC